MAEALEWMLGVVASANARGVKLQGEDDYHNWSNYGTPPESERPVPKRGDKVKVGLDNKGFLREITDKDGNKLGSGAGGGGNGANAGRSWTLADTRRVTLCSTLRSAAQLVAGLGLPETEGEQPKASVVTMRIAKAWAQDILRWAEEAEPRTNGNAD
jgi:hypothetical protein